jgi:hypothetical protein
MKNTLTFLAIAVLFITGNQSLAAQDEIATKLFYTELGGPGVIMSANFDGRFKPNERLGLGYRLGAGFGIGTFEEKPIAGSGGYYYGSVLRTYYSVPVGLNYVFGKSNSASTFEVGGGFTLLTRKVSLYNLDVDKPGNVIGFFTFMYRKIPVNGGFTFRVGFTPIIGTAGDLFPMGAVGFGYAF